MLTCYHPAETVAYGFSTVTMKLKPEYQGLSGKEIGQLKKDSKLLVYTRVYSCFARNRNIGTQIRGAAIIFWRHKHRLF